MSVLRLLTASCEMQAQDNGESATEALAQLQQARQELVQLHEASAQAQEASQADADALQSMRSQLQARLVH